MDFRVYLYGRIYFNGIINYFLVFIELSRVWKGLFKIFSYILVNFAGEVICYGIFCKFGELEWFRDF